MEPMRDVLGQNLDWFGSHTSFDPFFDIHLRMLVKSLDFGIRLTWAFVLSLVVKSGDTLLSRRMFSAQTWAATLSLFLRGCHSTVI